MRHLLAFLLLLAGGCDRHVEAPGATVVVDAPDAQPPDDSGPLAPAPDASAPLANVLTAQVTAVSDGDTLIVRDGANTEHRIRLQGIDAPEGEQPFSDESEQGLREKLLGETVRIEWRERDRYGRTLGHAYVGGRYINREMIADGWAWHYAYYWPNDEFAQAERDARAARRGLWADERPVAPWDFRRNPQLYSKAQTNGREPAGEAIIAPPPVTSTHPVGARGEASTESTVYVTRTGTKYHSAGCRHLRKSAISISLSEARQRYSPCSVCGGTAAMDR